MSNEIAKKEVGLDELSIKIKRLEAETSFLRGVLKDHKRQLERLTGTVYEED